MFRKSGRVVPVFTDKHIADNWKDASYIMENIQSMKIPLMAGSSVPGTWRRPVADVHRGSKVQEIVGITYGSTDHYGFHALEYVQALAEQRAGGETGISAVQCLVNDAVWEAQDQRRFDPELFQAAIDLLPGNGKSGRPLRDLVPKPILFSLEYTDGLRVHVLELNGAFAGWSAAWRYKDSGKVEAAEAWTQEGRPGMHFTLLLNGIEEMMLTNKPAWPAERTLMSSGALNALLTSRVEGGRRLETPYLEFGYQSGWRSASSSDATLVRTINCVVRQMVVVLNGGRIETDWALWHLFRRQAVCRLRI